MTSPPSGTLAALALVTALFASSPVAQESTNATDVLELQKRAESGDADAQSDLGWAYYRGNGVAQNPAQAVAWYRKSAAQGRASGQNRLGLAYQEGKGVAKDAREAILWYRRAADQGLLQAQLNLAWTYNGGLGVPRDYAEAAVWYRKAAEQGHPGAQSDLGVAYRNGEGVEKDLREAEQWFRKASEQGYAVATHRIGRMYWDGEFETTFSGGYMRTVGIEYFRTAATQGYTLSALTLAEIYVSRNRYVLQDYQQACMWASIAEGLDRRGGWDQRQPAATAEVRRRLPALALRIRKSLTDEQMMTCERQGIEWLAANPAQREP